MINLLGEEIEEEVEKEEDWTGKSKAVPFFDDIKLMFSNKNAFSEKSNYEKGRNMFMINRMFAIKHPLIADAFNKNGINAGNVVQSWCNILTPIYKSQPQWIWTTLNSLKKMKKTETVKKLMFSEEAIELYCKQNMVSRRDFDTWVEMFPKEAKAEMKDYENFVKPEVVQKR